MTITAETRRAADRQLPERRGDQDIVENVVHVPDPGQQPGRGQYSFYNFLDQRKNLTIHCPRRRRDLSFRNDWGVDLNRSFRVASRSRRMVRLDERLPRRHVPRAPWKLTEPETKNTIWAVGAAFPNIKSRSRRCTSNGCQLSLQSSAYIERGAGHDARGRRWRRDDVVLTRHVRRPRSHVAGRLGRRPKVVALSGDEDSSGDAVTGALTDPGEAAEFAERTGVDALAVAVGNVHGFTPEPVRLDLERLRAISAVCRAPLVLHGASGLPAQDLLGAVAAGVVKVNVNAELRRAHLDALSAGLAAVGDDVRALQRRAIEAMTEVAAEKIALLAGGR